MSSPKPFWLTRIVALSLALFFVAACDDDDITMPALGVDPGASAAVVDSVVNQFVGENDALETLGFLGPIIASITSSPSVAPAMPPVTGFGSASFAMMSSIERLTELPGLSPAINIPDALRGVTCIWDPTANNGAGGYVIDPTAAPLPTNTVRFRLYNIDPTTGLPALPVADNDIGFVDVRDDSNLQVTPLNVDVGLTAVVGGVTLVDYDVTGTFSETDFTLTVAGMLSDGVDNLNFSFTVAGSSTSFSSSFTLSLGVINVSLTFSATQDPTTNALTGGSLSVTISDVSTQDFIAFTINFDANGELSDSDVVINGEVVAVLTGNLFTDQVFISAADGSPLTNQQLIALANLFEGVEDIFEAMSELFVLGVGLIGIAVV